MKKFFKKIATKIAAKPSSEASKPAPAPEKKKADVPEGGEVWEPGKGSSQKSGEDKKPQTGTRSTSGSRKRSSDNKETKSGGQRRQDGQKRQGGQKKTDDSQGDAERKEGEGSSRQGGQRKRDGQGSSERSRGGQSRRGGQSSRPRSNEGGRPPRKSEGEKRTPRREGPPKPVAPPPKPEGVYDPDSFVVEPEEGKTRFHDLGLCDELMLAIKDLGFSFCTPIQAESLPVALDGKDVTGKAQTGTGKTAAFLIACYNRFLKNPIEGDRLPGTPRALIVAPTRELVIQIEKDALGLGKYCPPNVLAVYGGTGFNQQMDRLQSSVIDIVVATPGRLLQFNRDRVLSLKQVEVLVLDEADRMLDMGFIPDVRTIIRALPPVSRRQTFFYSATINQTVISLAREWTKDSVSVEVEPEQVAVDTVEQKVYTVNTKKKTALLYNMIASQNMERVLVFVNRRDSCDRVYHTLKHNSIDCEVLSGAVPQNKRTRILEDFRAGKLKVLIATDVAGRGLHIDGLDYVINYDIPFNAEEYVHRIGRTGRAGAAGTSITFACEEESFSLMDIEEYIGKSLPCEQPPEELLNNPPKGSGGRPPRRPSNGPGGGNRGGGGRGRGNGGGGNRRGGPGRGGPRRSSSSR